MEIIKKTKTHIIYKIHDRRFEVHSKIANEIVGIFINQFEAIKYVSDYEERGNNNG